MLPSCVSMRHCHIYLMSQELGSFTTRGGNYQTCRESDNGTKSWHTWIAAHMKHYRHSQNKTFRVMGWVHDIFVLSTQRLKQISSTKTSFIFCWDFIWLGKHPCLQRWDREGLGWTLCWKPKDRNIFCALLLSTLTACHLYTEYPSNGQNKPHGKRNN